MILWLSNIVGGLILIAIIAYQFSVFFIESPVKIPSEALVIAQVVQLPNPPENVGSTNPFDSTGIHWKTVNSEGVKGNGTLLGVIKLPGVNSALTSTGVVRIGETMAEGKLIGITDKKVILTQDTNQTEILLPSSKRPSIESLNKKQDVVHQDNKINKSSP